MKTYILWNSATGELAKRGKKFVTHEGKQPPTWDCYPRGFPSRDGWRYEEVVGTRIDRTHSGPARFEREDSQVARFIKIIGADN